MVAGRTLTWYAERLEAAHALWRITGDPQPALPVLMDLLGAPTTGGYGSSTTATAAAYLGELGPTAAAAAPALSAWLAGDHRARGGLDPHDAISWDERYQRTLATALRRICQRG